MLNLIALFKRFNCLFFILLLALLSGCKGGFGGSNDAGLTRLTLNPGTLTPAFAEETYEYSVTLALSEDSFVVNARVSEDDATMQLRRLTSEEGSVEETFNLSDDADSSSISIEVGDNYFDILVTSGDDSTKTYAITVKRQSEESDDASLESLEVEGVDLTFASGTVDYEGDVNYFTNSTRLKATVSDGGARIARFDGTGNLDSGTFSERQYLTAEQPVTYTITVEASDRQTTKDYSLALTRKEKSAITYKAFLKADDAADNARFGSSVAIDRDIVAVGALSDETDRGVVYFYEPESDTWGQTDSLAGGNSGDNFGASVALYGSTAVVGAPGQDNGRGRVLVYTRGSEGWGDVKTLQAGDATEGEQNFGSTVAFNGRFIAVTAGSVGKVYIFERNNASWIQRALIDNEAQGASPGFGASLAFNGDNELVIGAPDAAGAGNSETSAGAVYIYKRANSVWNYSQTLRSSNEAADNQFGFSVDVVGNTIAVGTPGNGTSGSVSIFKRDGSSSNYDLDQNLTRSDGNQSMAFGSSVSLFNETMLAVSAPGENKTDIGIDPSAQGNTAESVGAVFVYGYNLQTGNTNTYEWEPEMYIKARNNSSSGDRFGDAIAAYGKTLVVGVPNEDTASSTVNGSQDDSGEDVGAAFIIQ